ncbi:Hsp33 family molecular chaperone HslO [Porticoccus sp. W117]|uniref:Hsp33 family molecular chaperone HslO n=1 Tax=Porticoccus sp. W117 TaxID=3054777 RepID=UPI002598E6E6|nr:Hsp33 family molecular chaperone HslO [Porticoccus sp. W117]MDM3870928.1 Hsp33 family molecular chaperone HslO [Porticoccus sp. W117]
MSDSDKLQRFMFDHCDIRGEIITLEQSYQAVLQINQYPQAVQHLLGEFLAAAGLLSATLKFDGVITLQARGDGPLKLIVADCTRHHNLRAVAELDEESYPEFDFDSDHSLRELVGNGQLAITIDPSRGERYQGIVPLEQPTLAGCLEHYFRQSEQLPTRLWLSADSHRAGGLFLQALPRQTASDEQNEEQWQHLTQLAETISPQEQLQLAHQNQLYRLFHQDNVRLFDATDLQFACSCSQQRTAQMLMKMGRDELQSILAEQGRIDVNCHFCNQQYRFDASDINQLYSGEPPTLH